ncbi:NADP-dependent oxidoreductase domain-containing protein [Hypoxylon cercidicola]|nr:NADP-dependent oxidoreductase domain-containing protein [Hypoxylon cercidicola]
MAPTGNSPLNLVLGVASVGDTSVDPLARFDSPDEVNGILNTFAARGYHQLDTARVYSPHAPGTSEPRLGAVAAGDRFIIDTKVESRRPGDHTKAKVLKGIDISLEALKVKQINIEYLHKPDRATRFEEPCEAMDQAHKEGKIKYWGISSYTAKSVYQGQYNAVVRGGEKELFPVLRKNGIAFYAYSVAAGGFFAGNAKKAEAGGRYDQSHRVGSMYAEFYLKPSIMAAADNAVAVASKYGISGHAAALRWAACHSVLEKAHGDSIILGVSSSKQLDSNIDAIEQGPLPEDVVAAFEDMYGKIDKENEVSYHM